MSKKRTVQRTAIAFLLFAVILLIPNTDWSTKTSILGFFSLVLGTLGSIISIFIPTSYTYFFFEEDWKRNEQSNNYSLLITAKKHGLGNSPKVQTLRKNDLHFEEVGVSSHHDKKGNIIIGATITFEGKVIVT